MFEAGKVYKNRYGDAYTWVILSENEYQFRMTGDSMKWCRYGGKEGDESVDTSNLGMFDPSGGPYVCLGMEIDGKPIIRLSTSEDGLRADTERK